MKPQNTLAKVWVIILFMLASMSISAQAKCVLENNFFTRQSQLDSFPLLHPGCTKLRSIRIYTSGITDLSALGSLKNIDSLTIQKTAVTTLTGLDSLERCVQFDMWGNNSLTDIKALKKLKYVGSASLGENLSLTSLEGLSVDTASKIIISGGKLKSLKGLGARYCPRLYLANTSLDDLSGHNLSNVQYVILENVGNINAISSINPDKLSLYKSERLHDITPLNALTKLKWLDLAGNSNLSWCSIDIICRNLDNPDFTLRVYNNAKGCRNINEIREGCFVRVESHENSHIHISPQPVTDVINISGLLEDTPYRLINITGGQALSGMAYESIDISSLPAGMYLLQLYDKTYHKLLKSTKVVKM